MNVLKDRCMNCIIFHSISNINAKFPLLDAQVNVLLDAEAKVAVVGEVLLPQLVLLHLEAPLQDFLGLQVTIVRKGKNLVFSFMLIF